MEAAIQEQNTLGQSRQWLNQFVSSDLTVSVQLLSTSRREDMKATGSFKTAHEHALPRAEPKIPDVGTACRALKIKLID